MILVFLCYLCHACIFHLKIYSVLELLVLLAEVFDMQIGLVKQRGQSVTISNQLLFLLKVL